MSIPAAPRRYGYSRRHRAVEILCITAVFALLVGFCIRVPLAIQTSFGWLGLGVTVLVSYIASDIMSGIVHWAGDTIGNENIWFVGPNFIRPFREHHQDQKAITHHDFIETNGNNCIAVLGPLALAFVLLPDEQNFQFFACTSVALLALFILGTNQFHKWAHADNPPRIARPLQRWGLILSPVHHDIHHTVPHDKHYCITVGWMNPVLNAVRFFRAAEWIIAKINPQVLHIEERTRYAAEQAAAAAANMSAPRTPQTPAALS